MADLSTFLQSYAKEGISIAVPFIMWLIARTFENKAKLTNTTRHAFDFLIDEPLRDDTGNIIQNTQIVRTASVFVKNSGRIAATNVEIILNWEPQFFNVWPIRPYTRKLIESGRFVIELTSLAPDETFSIELMAINRNLPALCNIRSDQGESIRREMSLQPVLDGWKNLVVAILLIAGMVSVVWMLITGIQIISRGEIDASHPSKTSEQLPFAKQPTSVRPASPAT